jgi:16S rRNA (cytidine1402-2'-O)-methyltransferase
VALHEHNEDRIAEALIAEVRSGKSLAVISDAGTPLISDPGYALVRAARAASVPVVVIPGPCAAIAALSISGIATDSFVFVGFLPPKSAARRQRLEGLREEVRTLVVYESSHRIEESLADLHAVFGDSRIACVARELTKLHEESHTASLAELKSWLSADSNRQRGEFVVVVAGASQQADSDAAEGERVLRILMRDMSPSSAARAAAEITGVSRKQLYALAVQAADANGSSDAS